jgi:hypothetical protein
VCVWGGWCVCVCVWMNMGPEGKMRKAKSGAMPVRDGAMWQTKVAVIEAPVVDTARMVRAGEISTGSD